MQEAPFGLGVLVGLELTIARLMADMRGFHFGRARTTTSKSTPGKVLVIAEYALHIQCPWRLDGPTGVVTGGGDLHTYGGPPPEPEAWTYSTGHSLDRVRLDEVFGPLSPLGDGFHYSSGIAVTHVTIHPVFGDIAIFLSNDHVLRVFPDGSAGEQWRFFAPGDDSDHTVFGDDP